MEAMRMVWCCEHFLWGISPVWRLRAQARILGCGGWRNREIWWWCLSWSRDLRILRSCLPSPWCRVDHFWSLEDGGEGFPDLNNWKRQNKFKPHWNLNACFEVRHVCNSLMINNPIMLLKNGVNLSEKSVHHFRVLSKGKGQGCQSVGGCLESSSYKSDALREII